MLITNKQISDLKTRTKKRNHEQFCVKVFFTDV